MVFTSCVQEILQTWSGCVPLKAPGSAASSCLSLLGRLEPSGMDLFASTSLLFLAAFVGSSAAQVILPEGPVDAVLGGNVTLRTLLDKPSFLLIIWGFNNGEEQVNVATLTKTDLKPGPEFEGRVAIDANNGNLFVEALRSEDSGDYTINVVSEDGTTKTSEIRLRVLEPVSDVVVTSDVPEAIEHNSTVVLRCSAKGSFLAFAWFNGTAPVVDGERFTIKREETSSTLTIADVLRTDLARPISCTAANSLETERSAPFNLTVYYGPDEVAIAPPNPPEFIKSDSNFSLSCSAVSSPPATFSWTHDGQPMKHSGPALTLDVIRAQGFGKKPGQYACEASNDKTKRAVASAAVSFALMESISGIKVTGPTAALHAGNSSANLSCQATSGVVLAAAWLKDGELLPQSARLVFSDDMRSLTIETLQKEDNGVYTCRLSNPVSKEEASYKMEVVYGPEAVTVTGESAVEVNDKVVLTCNAPSVPPANFTWKFNGTKTDVKMATYTIEKAVYKNTGTYTCEAYNAATGKTVVSNHVLAVKEEGSLDEGLSDGAIAGIVIAILVALGAAIALIFYCRQKVPVESPY